MEAASQREDNELRREKLKVDIAEAKRKRDKEIREEKDKD